tara:strand:+ start:525 stop:668 length:144 start_codon:yes stop_codon:yes gene_type:complete
MVIKSKLLKRMSNYFLIVVLDKIYKLKVTNIPSLLTPHFQLKDKLEK